MLSLPQGIYILLGSVLGAVLGSIISGILLIINTSRNNNFQLERENQQRIWQAESERQKWYREKIYETYRTSIQILTKIIQAQFKSELAHEHDGSYDPGYDLPLELLINNLYFEFSSEFALIIVGHPDKETKEINEITTRIIDKSVFRDPFILRELITQIMEKDPRIKDVNGEYLNKQKSSTNSNFI
jgi:hypothetical protein